MEPPEPDGVFWRRRWELELRLGKADMESTDELLRERRALVSARGFLPAATSESLAVRVGEGGTGRSELLAMEARRLQRSTLMVFTRPIGGGMSILSRTGATKCSLGGGKSVQPASSNHAGVASDALAASVESEVKRQGGGLFWLDLETIVYYAEDIVYGLARNCVLEQNRCVLSQAIAMSWKFGSKFGSAASVWLGEEVVQRRQASGEPIRAVLGRRAQGNKGEERRREQRRGAAQRMRVTTRQRSRQRSSKTEDISCGMTSAA